MNFNRTTDSDKENHDLTLTGKCWLNGQLTLGVDSSRRRSRKNQIQEAKEWNTANDKQYYTITYHDEDGRELKGDSILLSAAFEHGLLTKREYSQALSLSNASIPHKTQKPRQRKGLKGISGRGKTVVRNAAYYLQKVWGKNRLGFCTLTLPPIDPLLLPTITGEDYARLFKIMRQKFTRYLAKRNAPSLESVWVVEIQEKRYEKEGYPYPHWHFVYVSKRYNRRVSETNPWVVEATDLRKMWKSTVRRWLKTIADMQSKDCMDAMSEISLPSQEDCRDDDTNFNASVNMQLLKKSAEGYLGKYASKGVKCIKVMKESNHEHLIPYQWWYCSSQLKQIIYENRLHISHKECLFIMEWLDELCRRKLVSWFAWMQREISVLTRKGKPTKDEDEPEYLTYGLALQLTPRGQEWLTNYKIKQLEKLASHPRFELSEPPW